MMKHRRDYIIRVACFLLLTATLPGFRVAQGADDVAALEEQAFKEAAAVVATSVVRIETVGGLERVGKMLAGTGPTTGVIVSNDGYIITSSFNFASKPSSILVTLPDGRRFAATQISTDQVKMLTLLKIEANGLVPAPAAPPNSYRVGQWAVALGRTYNSSMPNISVGIVSALHRIWGKAIQTDAKVSPVNYGGPLVDIQGRVLGVLVPLSPQGKSDAAGVEWYDAGIGFAIPMTDVYAVLDRLKAGDDLLSGLLGVGFKGNDLYGPPALLDRVRYDSPAQKAGLKPGDTIIEVNGQPISRVAQLRHALGSSYADDQVAVAVRRGEETIRVEIKLVGELVPYESAFLGILPRRSTSEADNQDSQGVGIRFVYENSPAAELGLTSADRILQIGGTAVATAEELRDAVSRVRPEEDVALTILSGGKSQTTKVRLVAIPATVPKELRPEAMEPPAEKAGEDAPQTGHFFKTLEEHEHDYWAFVPEDYNPAYNYGLMVWIHPDGDPMEATLLKLWKPICRERGIILLAPKANDGSQWSPLEAGFVKAAVEEFQANYSIDPERILLHSYSTGAAMASQLVFKERSLFRGLSLVAASSVSKAPENMPEFRLQVHLYCGEDDPRSQVMQLLSQMLQAARYPVTFHLLPGVKHRYVTEPEAEEIGRWIDALDRI